MSENPRATPPESVTDIEQAIVRFINEEIIDDDDETIEADDDLLSGGQVSSLAVIRIAGFLEDHFGIEVAETDLVIDHFISVQAMACYVEARRAGS